ncbi:MAG: (d)CMP kinase [Arenicella sp.]
MNNIPVLTIDGPSGAGKGTICQYAALHLGWNYLDSGAVYRALAWLAYQEKVSFEDEQALVELASKLQLVCEVRENDTAQIKVNGRVVNEELRTEETGELASKIAKLSLVRAELLAMQKRSAEAPGLVADGRDMGTVVFPDAFLKVFLTATAEVRAQRRYQQLKLKGFDVSIARLLEAIQARDARDSSRSASPLRAADDAIVIDTSKLSIDEVNSQVLDLVKQRLALSSEAG